MTIARKVDSVLTEESVLNGILILNRPKVLNAINNEMTNKISSILNQWKKTKKWILVKGAGEKSFCAGGDVRSIVETQTLDDARRFFKTQYTLDYTIATLDIPYVSFIDGITMGGGVGLSVHGKYRVATERTLFAMPETAIGLFPDVGGSHFLSRLPSQFGMYLGLTGFRLRGTDVLGAKIATHYCESSALPELEKELRSLSDPRLIGSVLDKHCVTSTKGQDVLTKNAEMIEKLFTAESVEGIFYNLERDGSEWSLKTLEVSFRNSRPEQQKFKFFHVFTDTENDVATKSEGHFPRIETWTSIAIGRVFENGISFGASFCGRQ